MLTPVFNTLVSFRWFSFWFLSSRTRHLWGCHTSHSHLQPEGIVLYHFRWWGKFGIFTVLQKSFYITITMSVLSASPSGLENVGLRTRQPFIGWSDVLNTSSEHQCLQDIYTRQCCSRIHRILKDSHHVNHKLFQRLPFGKHLWSIKARRDGKGASSFRPYAARTIKTWHWTFSYSHCSLHLWRLLPLILLIYTLCMHFATAIFAFSWHISPY